MGKIVLSSPRRADSILLELQRHDPHDILRKWNEVAARKSSVKDEADGTESLTDKLWNATKEYHKSALETPFIQDMKDGTLNPVNFGIYNLQDAIYCHNSTEALEITAGKSDDPVIEKFAKKKITSYHEYTRQLFEQWHIGSVNGITLGSAAESYSKHELFVAKNLAPIYTFVAMIPCNRLWPWLGKEMRKTSTSFGVYKAWIDENFTAGSNTLEDFVNARADTIDWEVAMDVYKKSMEGEYEFFNSAS